MAKKSFPVYSMTLHQRNFDWFSTKVFVWISPKTKGVCSNNVVLCNNGLHKWLHLPNVDELVVDFYPRQQSNNSFKFKLCKYEGDIEIEGVTQVWVGSGLWYILKQIMKDYQIDSLWVKFCYYDNP